MNKKNIHKIIFSVSALLLLAGLWLAGQFYITQQAKRYMQADTIMMGVFAGQHRLRHEQVSYKPNAIFGGELITRLKSDDLLFQEKLGDIYFKTDITWGPLTTFSGDWSASEELLGFSLAGFSLRLVKAKMTTQIDPRYSSVGDHPWLSALGGQDNGITGRALLGLSNQLVYQVSLPKLMMAYPDEERGEPPLNKKPQRPLLEQQDIVIQGHLALNDSEHEAHFTTAHTTLHMDKLAISMPSSSGILWLKYAEGMGLKVGNVDAQAEQVSLNVGAKPLLNNVAMKFQREHHWFNQGQVVGNMTLLLDHTQANTAISQQFKRSVATVDYRNISTLGLLDLINLDARIGNLYEQKEWLVDQDGTFPEGRRKLLSIEDAIEVGLSSYDEVIQQRVFVPGTKEVTLNIQATPRTKGQAESFLSARFEFTGEDKPQTDDLVLSLSSPLYADVHNSGLYTLLKEAEGSLSLDADQAIFSQAMQKTLQRLSSLDMLETKAGRYQTKAFLAKNHIDMNNQRYALDDLLTLLSDIIEGIEPEEQHVYNRRAN